MLHICSFIGKMPNLNKINHFKLFSLFLYTSLRKSQNYTFLYISMWEVIFYENISILYKQKTTILHFGTFRKMAHLYIKIQNLNKLYQFSIFLNDIVNICRKKKIQNLLKILNFCIFIYKNLDKIYNFYIFLWGN